MIKKYKEYFKKINSLKKRFNLTSIDFYITKYDCNRFHNDLDKISEKMKKGNKIKLEI
ncbi:MAG: hypothetical protein LBM96_10830 [Methanobrevibacter sp.]|jgi:hypothetical protein|nr:hypothetical protein [Candidatus Methanoflexus mossambicus]